MNLFAAPLFAARIGSQLRYLTLREALLCIEPGSRLQHPLGFLTGPLRLLAQALTQHLAAHAGNITRAQWSAAVFHGQVGPVVEQLFNAAVVERASAGFGLFAESAFMQVPDGLFSDMAGEPIEGLFQPFRPRRGADAKAKALRIHVRGIEAVCPCCAALGVFSTQLFSGSMAQYWGAAPTRGACVYGLLLPAVGTSILANVLHEESDLVHARPLHGPPWSADCQGAAGFDSDLRMPFEKHLFENGRMVHPANVSFPFIRALRLVAPRADDEGACDVCARPQQPLVRRLRLLPEPAVRARVASTTLCQYKQEYGEDLARGGVLQGAIEPGAQHPALAYIEPPDKGAAAALPYAQMAQGGFDDFRQARPAWVQMLQLLGQEGVTLPAVMRQLVDDPLAASAATTMSLTMFGVRFEGATNPNPKCVLDAVYGVHHLLLKDTSDRLLGGQARALVEFVESRLDAWISAAQVLEHDVRQTPEGFMERLVPGSVQRRGTIRTGVLQDPVLWTGAEQLWDTALREVYALCEAWASIHDEDGDSARLLAPAKAVLARQADDVWGRFLDMKMAPDASLQQLFLEAQAQREYDRCCHGKRTRSKEEQPAITAAASDGVSTG